MKLVITNYHNFHVSSKLGSALTHLIGQNARDREWDEGLMAEEEAQNILDSPLWPTRPETFYFFRSSVPVPGPHANPLLLSLLLLHLARLQATFGANCSPSSFRLRFLLAS